MDYTVYNQNGDKMDNYYDVTVTDNGTLIGYDVLPSLGKQPVAYFARNFWSKAVRENY